MLNHKPFTKTATLYDAIYTKKQYAREARVINKLIRSNRVRGKTLLDLGCGTGKHCIEFARLGYVPTGIDCSLPMLTVARQNMKEAHCSFDLIHTDIINYRVQKKIDAAVSLFHVLSYQLTSDSLIKFFQTAHRCIKPGGLFIFDCWYGPGVFLHTPKNRAQVFKYNNSRITRNKKSVWDMEHNVVRVYHEIFLHGINNPPIHELHSMRYFFIPELRHVLSTTGFRLLQWGKLGFPLVSIGKNPPWEIWLVAQRI